MKSRKSWGTGTLLISVKNEEKERKDEKKRVQECPRPQK